MLTELAVTRNVGEWCGCFAANSGNCGVTLLFNLINSKGVKRDPVVVRELARRIFHKTSVYENCTSNCPHVDKKVN